MDTEENDWPLEVLPLKKAVLLLQAGNHPLRQHLLKLIHRHGRISVTGICIRLRLEPLEAIQHLAVLHRAGIVGTQTEGKKIFYRVNYQRLHQLTQLVSALLI